MARALSADPPRTKTIIGRDVDRATIGFLTSRPIIHLEQLAKLHKIAKNRTRKAKQLLKARKKAHAARKAGFTVKRKK